VCQDGEDVGAARVGVIVLGEVEDFLEHVGMLGVIAPGARRRV